MIGRDTELTLVGAFLDGLGTRSRALMLHGEAGIGKSTIWQAALEAARRHGYRVVTTRPTEAEARLPFAGLNDLFGGLLEVARPELPAPQQLALDVALMRTSVEGGPIQPLALSLAVLELLRAASAQQPLALGVDDVQWLDQSTAGVLRFALRRLESEPVIVVATQRTTDPAASAPALDELPAAAVTRVAVSGLGPEEMDRLLHESLGLELPPNALRRVHALSGGNPFYAVEIGRALQARGASGSTEELPIPESLGGLLRRRLDALSPAACDVVRYAAALSQPTTVLLEGALGVERARSGIAEAREAAVLAPGDDSIRFSHPLLAAEAYASIDEAQRSDLHRRLAAVVGEPEELARHLALASFRPDATVAGALATAAVHAHARGAPDAAAELSEMASALTPDDDAARHRRIAAAARYRMMAGDLARAREMLEDALADDVGPKGPARAELLLNLATVRQLLDDFLAAGELAREALGYATGEPRLLIDINLLLAGVSHITGRDWAAGARHAEEAMRLADELGDPRLLAGTVGHYAVWRHNAGRGIDRGLERRAAELEPWTGHLRTLDVPAFDFAVLDLLDGAMRAAHEGFRQLLARAERDGDYSSLPFLLGHVASADFLDGQGDAARGRLERGERLAQVTGQRAAEGHMLVFRSRLEARWGNADSAWQAASRAFDVMRATGWQIGEWFMRAELALLELSRNDPAAALEVVTGAVEPDPADESARWVWGTSAAIEALVALGRHEVAGRLLAQFEEHATSAASPRRLGEARRARALLLAAQGDVDRATESIAEAEAIHRRMEESWEVARTLLIAGEVHRRGRHRAKARASLAEALEAFELFGARLWAERAREQLARIAAARRDGDALTATQREVAELVASGLTNRQVGDRLFMSVHTVEAHLSAVYRSLGIRSRTELASALRDSASDVRDSADVRVAEM